MSTAPPVEAPPDTRRRTRWSIVVWGAAIVAAAVWLVLGLTPKIGTGSFFQADPEAADVLESGFPASVVTDPQDGTYDGAWSFRNNGWLPVTVRIAPNEVGNPIRTSAVHPVDPPGNYYTEPAEAVAVAPGEEFSVWFAFSPGCAPHAPGNTISTRWISLRVTTLGLSRVVDLETDFRPVGVLVTEDFERPDSCG